jgi:hypothetical protein
MQIVRYFIILFIGVAIGFFARDFAVSLPSKMRASNAKGNASTNTIRADDAEVGRASGGFEGSRPGSDNSPVTRREVEALRGQLPEMDTLDERARKLSAIMTRWALADGRAAFEYAREMMDWPAFLKVEAITAVGKVLAVSDPQYLAEAAARLPEDASRQALILALANPRADTNSQDAFAWAAKLPDGRIKSNAVALLRARLAKEDPQKAVQMLDQIPNGLARRNFVAEIAAQWGLNDPEAASLWVQKLPEAERQNVIPVLAASWAQSHPADAGNFVAQLPSGEMQNRAVMSVVANWAMQDPRTTASWVAEFPNDALRELGIREAVSEWSRMDADAALNWVKQLSNVDTRDIALKSYVESLAYWAPERSAAMVDLIQDPVRREQSMETAMRSWSEVDPQAAERWLSHLNIRDGLRNRLRAILSSN